MKQIFESYLAFFMESRGNPYNLLKLALPRSIPGFLVLALNGGAIGYVGYNNSKSLAQHLGPMTKETAPQLVQFYKVH